MEEKEYQKEEVKRFLNQKYAFFDTVREFSEHIENSDPLTDLEWIENGSYGAGACLVLQCVFNGLNKRTNNLARIGSVLLNATYGKTFNDWNKLSLKAKDMLNKAVGEWLNQKKSFAIKLII
jgi:hypothetical protein